MRPQGVQELKYLEQEDERGKSHFITSLKPKMIPMEKTSWFKPKMILVVDRFDACCSRLIDLMRSDPLPHYSNAVISVYNYNDSGEGYTLNHIHNLNFIVSRNVVFQESADMSTLFFDSFCIPLAAADSPYHHLHSSPASTIPLVSCQDTHASYKHILLTLHAESSLRRCTRPAKQLQPYHFRDFIFQVTKSLDANGFIRLSAMQMIALRGTSAYMATHLIPCFHCGSYIFDWESRAMHPCGHVFHLDCYILDFMSNGLVGCPFCSETAPEDDGQADPIVNREADDVESDNGASSGSDHSDNESNMEVESEPDSKSESDN